MAQKGEKVAKAYESDFFEVEYLRQKSYLEVLKNLKSKNLFEDTVQYTWCSNRKWTR